ncbi:RNA-binding protein with serine-rich domain 1 [Cichlidogyrus casuarinus]|uniref:RNA-binding protein with serine-rich domain 1 n=1 Tax=Cichlidogyrus casuarinus TaxID=1844966 RepID=A0ABD2QCZ0_9PLAT
MYGAIVSVDFPVDPVHKFFGRGHAIVQYDTAQAANDAINHMNGGVIDGLKISVAAIMPAPPEEVKRAPYLAPKRALSRSPIRRRSPPPRGPRRGRTPPRRVPPQPPRRRRSPSR